MLTFNLKDYDSSNPIKGILVFVLFSNSFSPYFTFKEAFPRMYHYSRNQDDDRKNSNNEKSPVSESSIRLQGY